MVPHPSPLPLCAKRVRVYPSDWQSVRTCPSEVLRNDRFGWAGVAVWHVLLVMGFIFVAHITEKRPNPLRSRRGHYRVQLQRPSPSPFALQGERSDWSTGPAGSGQVAGLRPASLSTGSSLRSGRSYVTPARLGGGQHTDPSCPPLCVCS